MQVTILKNNVSKYSDYFAVDSNKSYTIRDKSRIIKNSSENFGFISGFGSELYHKHLLTVIPQEFT